LKPTEAILCCIIRAKKITTQQLNEADPRSVPRRFLKALGLQGSILTG
jgi:hypothetical protein